MTRPPMRSCANDTPADVDAICTIPQFSAVHSFVMTASVFGFEFEWEAFSLLSFAITKSDAKIRISIVQYVDRVIALIIIEHIPKIQQTTRFGGLERD